MLTNGTFIYLRQQHRVQTRLSKVILNSSSIRQSSQLPQKQQDSKWVAAIKDNINRDPVPQALIKKINCEYHGVAPLNFNDETIWFPIYRFPYTKALRSTIRFKVYLTFSSIFVCSLRISELLMNQNQDLLAPTLLSVFTLSGLLILGDFFRKFICQVYATENTDYVRLCRFTFFGRRMDMVLPREAIIPLTETNATNMKSFHTLMTRRPDEIDTKYDTYEFWDEKFKLCLAMGGVLDKDRFVEIFGKYVMKIR